MPACSVILVSSATALHAKLRLERGSVQSHRQLVDAEIGGDLCKGFVTKSDSEQLLERAIETLLEHRPFFTSTAAAR
jgi:hypothetical protein